MPSFSGGGTRAAAFSFGGGDAAAVLAVARMQHLIVVRKRWRQRLARGRVPNPRRFVLGRCHDSLSVGTELSRFNFVIVLQRFNKQLTARNLPNSRGVVV